MNCAQIKERLLDYLYDEMAAKNRAAFAEHLRDCTVCRAEVASFARTVGHARSALTGPLMQEPPARVHRAVLAAAQAAAQSTRKVPARDEPGFFARFWRTPWLLPVFGAASVATVVFLVRVLKNPEVLPSPTPQAVEEAMPPMLEATRPAPAAQWGVAEKTAAQALGADKAAGAPADSSGIKSKRARLAPPAPGLSREKRLKGDDGMDYLKLDGESGRGGLGRFEDMKPKTIGQASPAPPPAAVAAPKPAVPSASLAAPTPVLAPPTAEPAELSARRPLARPARSRASEAEGAPMEASDELVAQPLARKESARGAQGPSLEESVKKAERVFAAQDWAAAAGIYRDLLNRFPTHKDTPKWRERLNASLVAQREGEKAKAAKASKSSSKALDTGKVEK